MCLPNYEIFPINKISPPIFIVMKIKIVTSHFLNDNLYIKFGAVASSKGKIYLKWKSL